MARQSKPSALKDLAGNPGKRAPKPNRPTPPAPAKFPGPPKNLGLHGRRYWKEVGPDLLATGVFTMADFTAFLLLCDSIQVYAVAKEEIREGKSIVEDTDAGFRKSPYLAIKDQQHAQILTLLKEFGMTPRARENVSGYEPDDDDPIGDLMKLNGAN
jgi:P27 family predicted phage terminase small subunit